MCSGESELVCTRRPGAETLKLREHLGPHDLFIAAGKIGAGLALDFGPAFEAELEAAVVAVPGIGRPVCPALTICNRVPQINSGEREPGDEPVRAGFRGADDPLHTNYEHHRHCRRHPEGDQPAAAEGQIPPRRGERSPFRGRIVRTEFSFRVVWQNGRSFAVATRYWLPVDVYRVPSQLVLLAARSCLHGLRSGRGSHRPALQHLRYYRFAAEVEEVARLPELPLQAELYRSVGADEDLTGPGDCV